PHALLFLNSSRDPRDPPSFPTRRLPIHNLMTRRETVGQCFMLGFAGTSVSRDLADLLARYRPGGIILFSRNLETPAQIVRLTNDLQKLSPQTPLLISVDQEGGRVSRLP